VSENNVCSLYATVAEIHDDLEKAKKESLKDRIPPRAPKDKPTVVEGKDDTLQYDWLYCMSLYWNYVVRAVRFDVAYRIAFVQRKAIRVKW